MIDKELFSLMGKGAIVTGGGGALGSAIALGLAAQGAELAVIDFKLEAAEKIVSTLKFQGFKAHAYSGDMGTESVAQSIISKISSEMRIDVLVNAMSGPIDRHSPEVFPLEEWDYTLKADLTSYFLSSKYVAQNMISNSTKGSIINFGSIASMSALGRGSLAYSVAKAGILQLTRETAFAWAPHGIRVNAILPSQFKNSWWESIIESGEHPELLNRVLTGIPLGRFGEPSEIVGPVVFLASEASVMVTGVILPVDGGNLSMNAGASLKW